MKRALVVASLALTACGAPEAPSVEGAAARAQAIVNGRPVDATELEPSGALLVSIEKDGELFGAAYCSATLIAPDAVLTAGHCDIGPEIELAHIIYFSRAPDLSAFGGAAADLPVDAIRVTDMITYAGYMLGGANDLAIALLERGVVGVEPARLAGNNGAAYTPAVGETLVTAGYGRHEALLGAMDPNSGLRSVGTGVITETFDLELLLGPGPDGSSKCRGDSGGGSFTEAEATAPILVSVASRVGEWEQGCLGPLVETRVDAYLKWIIDSAGVTSEGEVSDEGGCAAVGATDVGALACTLGLLVSRRAHRRRKR